MKSDVGPSNAEELLNNELYQDFSQSRLLKSDQGLLPRYVAFGEMTDSKS